MLLSCFCEGDVKFFWARNAWLEFSLVGMGHFPTFYHPPQNMVLWLNSCSVWVLIPSRYIAGKYLYLPYLSLSLYIYMCVWPGWGCCPGKCVLTAQGQCFMHYIYIIYIYIHCIYHDILWVWIHPPKRQNSWLKNCKTVFFSFPFHVRFKKMSTNLRSTLTACCFDALLRSKEDDYMWYII